MAGNSKLATAIHIAGMLSFADKMPLTSEMIAQSVGTNPVVIRRIIGLLTKNNLVKVKMGTGGGASLAAPAEDISLGDIYAALDEDSLFDVPQFADEHQCAIGKIVRPVLAEILSSIEKKLLDELTNTTLADVIGKVKLKMTENCNKNNG